MKIHNEKGIVTALLPKEELNAMKKAFKDGGAKYIVSDYSEGWINENANGFYPHLTYKVEEKETTLKPFTREDMRKVAIVVIGDADRRIDWTSEGKVGVYGRVITYSEILKQKIQGYTFDGELINLWHEVTE